MAQNITLLGASYTAVPAVTLPKTGGGTAKFSDASVTTAVASDVAEGKIFLLADGTQATGTGKGGGSVTWELMADQTCTITTYEGMRIVRIDGYNEPLSANETYRITWGDNQYICNTIADPVGFTQDGYYMGNSSIFGSQYEDTGEPFVFYRTSSTRMTGVTNDTTSSSVYVKIERQTTSSATLITKSITANGTYSASDDDADGYSSVTVNVPSGGGSDFPKFTVTYDPSTSARVSGVCDKTFAQCLDYIDAGKTYGELTEVWDASYSAYGTVTWFDQGDDYVIYTAMNGTSPMYDIRYNSDGTIVFTEPSANNVVLNITQNGTTYPTGVVTEVNVNVPLNVNVQIVQSTTRRNNTALGSITSLTCSTAGTYDVYWTCARSNTSQTWGSQLYINGVAYGTENTTWSNNVQNNHLTGVVLSANDTVAVYGRSRSGYYIHAPQLTIVQTA